jgi:hypothetical protein
MTFPHGYLDFLAPTPACRNKLDEYEIDPDRLVYFNGVLQQISGSDLQLNMDQIVTAAKACTRALPGRAAPGFRRVAIALLAAPRRNGGERGLAARRRRPATDRTPACLCRRAGRLLPDALPVIGQLDDALLIDVAVQVLRDELADYEDYCRFCQVAADFASVDIAEVHLTRAQWCQALSQAYDGSPHRQHDALRTGHPDLAVPYPLMAIVTAILPASGRHPELGWRRTRAAARPVGGCPGETKVRCPVSRPRVGA